jgi:endoglucanase
VADYFIKTDGTNFSVDGQDFVMRGIGLGSWMNLEHYMIGIPGSEQLIRQTLRQTLGAQEAAALLHSYLTCFVGEDDFRYLKSIGINSIRIPVNYHYFLDDENPQQLKDEGFLYLDRVAKLCAAYQIYMIIDLHAAPGAQNPDWHSDNAVGIPLFWQYQCFREQAVKIWAHIAAHYRGNPWVGGYDILNEPFFIPDKEDLNTYYAACIRAIREVDSDHVIFLEGDHFAMDFSTLRCLEDANLALEFHYYPTVWNPQVMDPDFPEAKRQDILKETFAKQAAIREKFQRPIWCGELGCEFKKDNMAFMRGLDQSMLDLCEASHVSWTLWNYKDAQVMGLAVPKDDSPWMQWTAPIRQGWTQDKEKDCAQGVLHFLEQSGFSPISEDLNYQMQFRLRAAFQKIYCEQLLVPALQALSPEQRKALPTSFQFQNCQICKEIESLLRSYTGA